MAVTGAEVGLAGAWVDLAAPAPALLRGRVVGPAGEVAGDVTIQGARGEWTLRVGEDGFFSVELPTGDYGLAVPLAGDWVDGPQTVHVMKKTLCFGGDGVALGAGEVRFVELTRHHPLSEADTDGFVTGLTVSD